MEAVIRIPISRDDNPDVGVFIPDPQNKMDVQHRVTNYVDGLLDQNKNLPVEIEDRHEPSCLCSECCERAADEIDGSIKEHVDLLLENSIVPKFKPGDKVWFLNANKAVNMTVIAVKVDATFGGWTQQWASAEASIQYGVTNISDGVEAEKISRFDFQIEEARCFGSKQALLASL